MLRLYKNQDGIERNFSFLKDQVVVNSIFLKINHDKDVQYRLDEALKLNQPLATAYYLKEDPRRFWRQNSKAAAEKFLYSWIGEAESGKISKLKRFVKTLRGHMFGLLDYYNHHISTGPLEGTNNEIKTLRKQAYGFRDTSFFKLKIQAPHENKYALIG